MEFKTLSEFNNLYNTLRNDILKRHNIKDGQKVRLKNAIALYQNMDGQWIKITSVKSDMTDRIKMYNSINKDVSFKLVAMV